MYISYEGVIKVGQLYPAGVLLQPAGQDEVGGREQGEETEGGGGAGGGGGDGAWPAGLGAWIIGSGIKTVATPLRLSGRGDGAARTSLCGL